MHISQNEIQSRFPSLEHRLVAEIIDVAEVRHCKKGQFPLRKGHYIRSVFLIMEGLVKVVRESDNGNSFFVHYLEGGDACVLSMICTTRHATSELTLMAVTDTTILAIPLSCMHKWIVQYNSWYQFVWDCFGKRLEELFTTIDTIAFRTIDERLVYYLKLQTEKLHSNVIPLTRTEIAKEMNSSREVVSRSLKKLSMKGKLKLNRQSIEVIDLT
jgi:CRP/FNR family transcriptional regulator, anaerobic regulatory protein